MSVLGPRASRHGTGQWEAVRDAIASNPCTARYCLVLLVTGIRAPVIMALMQRLVL